MTEPDRRFIGYDVKQVGVLSWRCEMIEEWDNAPGATLERTYDVVHGLTRKQALRRARRIMRRRWRSADRLRRTAERIPA